MGRHPQMRRRPLAAEPIAVWWMLLLRARTRIVTAAESEVETVGEESGTLKGKESWAMALAISSREREDTRPPTRNALSTTFAHPRRQGGPLLRRQRGRGRVAPVGLVRAPAAVHDVSACHTPNTGDD